MDDRENTAPHHQEPQPNTTKPLDSGLASSASDSEKPHNEEIHECHEADPEPPERWFRNPDWWMVFLTALILVATIITAIIFYRQFKEMARQTGILNSQAQQAAKDSVDAAERVRDQLDIAKKQAAASQDSVKAIRRQMMEDQKAWLKPSVDPAGVQMEGDKNAAIIALVRFSNTGKTAAKQVLMRVVMQKVENGRNPVFVYKNPVTHITVGAMYSGETSPPLAARFLKLGESGQVEYPNLPASEFQELRDGKAFVVVFGRVDYLDIFNVRHWAQFCSWTNMVDQGKAITYTSKKCSDYNSVDNN